MHSADAILSLFRQDFFQEFMANLKASKKALRQAAKRTEANRTIRRKLYDLIKKTRQLISKGDHVLAQEFFKKTTKALDKAAKKNIIHKNKASRHKSSLALKLNAVTIKAKKPKKQSLKKQ